MFFLKCGIFHYVPLELIRSPFAQEASFGEVCQSQEKAGQ